MTTALVYDDIARSLLDGDEHSIMKMATMMRKHGEHSRIKPDG
jgi:hypothetical protein